MYEIRANAPGMLFGVTGHGIHRRANISLRVNNN